MGRYYVAIPAAALSTTNDSLTLIAAANRRVKIFEIAVFGLGTASAANTLRVARSTGGATPGGAQTLAKAHSDQANATTLAYTTWATQPTLSDVEMRIGVNANGGAYRWVAMPGKEIEIRNSEQLSFRSENGTSSVTITVGIDED